MTPRDLWRSAKQWVPFAARTAMYGSLSVTLGPMTSDRRVSLWAMRKWCIDSTRALAIEVVADGLDNIPSNGAFVYTSNHQSIVDIIVLGSVLRGDYKWVAKRSLLRVPFLGWHLALSGHVPVDRGGGPRAAAEVIERFVKVLGDGKPLLIFPEGTRTADGNLKSFKNGGFYAAVRANVPVVPVALNGTFDLMRRGAPNTGENNLRRVRVSVGTPIYPTSTGRESIRVNDLRERAHAAVTDQLLSIGGLAAPRSASRNDGESATPEDRAEP
ncbi:MAG: lysophospholipid acyltransferase family protein [Polyangiaceae bacterium]